MLSIYGLRDAGERDFTTLNWEFLFRVLGYIKTFSATLKKNIQLTQSISCFFLTNYK